MFENIKANFTKFKERVENGVKIGWNGLKEKMGQMRDRVGIFGEESLAEIAVVTAPVVNGVRQVAEGTRNAYQAVEGNIFKRLGNVAKEGWANMKEKFSTLKENVGNKINDLKKRDASEGVMTFVHDALNSIEELPMTIQAYSEMFQEKKLEVINKKVDIAIDKGNNNRAKRLGLAYLHIENRREKFEQKAIEMALKISKMRKERAKLAVAVAGVAVTA